MYLVHYTGQATFPAVHFRDSEEDAQEMASAKNAAMRPGFKHWTVSEVAAGKTIGSAVAIVEQMLEEQRTFKESWTKRYGNPPKQGSKFHSGYVRVMARVEALEDVLRRILREI